MKSPPVKRHKVSDTSYFELVSDEDIPWDMDIPWVDHDHDIFLETEEVMSNEDEDDEVMSDEGSLSESDDICSRNWDDTLSKSMKRTLSFKHKVHKILKTVNDQAAGEFVVSGKLHDAPVVVISIKNLADRNVHFPLFEEEEVHQIIKVFKQSQYETERQSVVHISSVGNLLQLDPQGFKILNAEWDKYMENVVLPRIGNEMVINTSFTASLYKLHLYKVGSFYPHCDPVMEDGMFGKLVIQLPSKYKGGQLIVNHEGKAITIDFSSHSATAEEFSTYYSAFYYGCPTGSLPVTEGFRFFLIYNLISTVADSVPIPPERSPFEAELKAALRNWKSSEKIVYALRYQYSVENLSFENLKGTDRAVAGILKYLSKECALDSYLAVFETTSRGTSRGDIYFSDSDDTDFESNRDHSLNSLTTLYGHDMLPNSRLTVNFLVETIPRSCFSCTSPYHRDYEYPCGRGDIIKYYRVSAIVFWPRKNVMNVLRMGSASTGQMIVTFIKEVEIQSLNNGTGTEAEKNRKTLAKVAESILKLKRHYLQEEYKEVDLLTAVVKLKNVKLIQAFCESTFIMSPDILPLIANQCEIYGWETFIVQLITMFQKDHASIRLKDTMERLDLMIGDTNKSRERRTVLVNLMYAILDKYKGRPSEYQLCNEENKKSHEEDLHSIVRVARKIDFDMVKLLQMLCQEFIVINESIIPWIASEIDKYGWKSFFKQVPLMFKRICNFRTESYFYDAVDLLELLIGKDAVNLSEHKKVVCRKIVDVILEAIDKRENIQLCPQKSQKWDQEKDEKVVYSLYSSAQKITKCRMIKLLQTFCQKLVNLNPTNLPWIVNKCNNYPWRNFAAQFSVMFERVSNVMDAAEFLKVLIRERGAVWEDGGKNEVCCRILTAILDRIKKGITFSPNESKQDSEEKLLYSLCLSAHKINGDMILEFMKTRAFTAAVPVLISLTQSSDLHWKNALRGKNWVALGRHFISEMMTLLLKNEVRPSWRIDIANSCSCDDCSALDAFLKSDLRKQAFSVKDVEVVTLRTLFSLPIRNEIPEAPTHDRLDHLSEQWQKLEISHQTSIFSDIYNSILIVEKTVKSGQDDFDKRQKAFELYPKLFAIIPKPGIRT